MQVCSTRAATSARAGVLRWTRYHLHLHPLCQGPASAPGEQRPTPRGQRGSRLGPQDWVLWARPQDSGGWAPRTAHSGLGPQDSVVWAASDHGLWATPLSTTAAGLGVPCLCIPHSHRSYILVPSLHFPKGHGACPDPVLWARTHWGQVGSGHHQATTRSRSRLPHRVPSE